MAPDPERCDGGDEQRRRDSAARETERLLAAVDADDRAPSDDPSGYMALVRAWRDRL